MEPLTLWSDTPRKRFFLIPDDQQLPSGDLLLRTVTGRKEQVDSSSAAAFEVTEEEARNWLASQFGKMLDTARDSIHHFLDRLGGGDAGRIARLRAHVESLENAAELLADSTVPLTPAEAAELHQLAGRLADLATRIHASTSKLHSAPDTPDTQSA